MISSIYTIATLLCFLATSAMFGQGTTRNAPFSIGSLPCSYTGTPQGYDSDYDSGHACCSIYMDTEDIVFEYSAPGNQIARVGQFQIFLSPDSGSFTPQCKASPSDGFCKVIILDMDGHVVFQKNYQVDGASQLRVEDHNKLPTGGYAFQFCGEGVSVTAERLVVL